MRDYENCWFKGTCNKECSSYCGLYLQFKYLLQQSNIPVSYSEPKALYPQEEDYNAFKTLATIKKDIVNFVDKGRMLYLYSTNCGNGKTSFICKIMLTYMGLVAKYCGFNVEYSPFFCHVPKFILMSTAFNDENRKAYLEAMHKRKLVVFDDIGSVDAGKFANTNLAEIIDYRYANKLSSLYTSNLTEGELQNLLGARNADRILSDISIKLVGNSRRECKHEYKEGE